MPGLRCLCVLPPPCDPFRAMPVRQVCRAGASRRRKSRRIGHPSRRLPESKATGLRRRRPSSSCRRAVRPRRAVRGQKPGHRFRARQPLRARSRVRCQLLQSKPAVLRRHGRLSRAPAHRVSRRRRGLSRVSLHPSGPWKSKRPPEGGLLLSLILLAGTTPAAIGAAPPDIAGRAPRGPDPQQAACWTGVKLRTAPGSAAPFQVAAAALDPSYNPENCPHDKCCARPAAVSPRGQTSAIHRARLVIAPVVVSTCNSVAEAIASGVYRAIPPCTAAVFFV